MRLFPSNLRKRWLLISTVLTLILFSPILVIITGLFTPSNEVWEHVKEHLLIDYIYNTVISLLGVGAVALLFGVPTAYAISKYKFPLSRFFSWALILPLAIPAYIAVYAWSGMFSFTGPYSILLRSFYDLETANKFFIDIKQLSLLIIILASVLYPYIYLSAKGAFENLSLAYIEVAKSMGMGRIKVFFKVSLPLARPLIVAGLFLVIMETISDYGAMHYFGIQTLTVGIFRSWFGLHSLDVAIKLSTVLLLFILISIYLEKLSRGKAKFTENKQNRRTQKVVLKGWQAFIAFFYCSIVFTIGFLIPFSYLLYNAISNIENLFTEKLFLIIVNSIYSSFIGSILIILIALFILYSDRLNPIKYSSYITRLSALGYSIPGAVIAVGIIVVITQIIQSDIFSTITFSTFSNVFYTGSYYALLLAYIIRFMAVAYNPIQAGFDKLSKHTEEQSISLGKPPWQTLLFANIPALKNYILAAGILVFVDLLKELPITLILRPFNFDTLATYVFQLANDELLSQAALPAVLIILIGIVPILFINKLIEKNKWQH